MRGNLVLPSSWSGETSHPLWRGLQFAMPGWTPDDVVSGLKATFNGNASTVVGRYGPAINQGGASAYLNYPVFSDTVASPIWGRGGIMAGPITLLAVHTPSSNSQTCLFNFSDNVSSLSAFALIWSIDPGGTGGTECYEFWNDNNGNGPADPDPVAVDQPHVVIGRRHAAQTASPTLDLWVDGAIKATTTSTIEESAGNSTEHGGNLLSVNRFGGYNGYYGAGTLHALYAWRRPLSDGECRALTDDPWVLFRRPSTRSWVGWLTDPGPPLPIGAYAATWDDFAATQDGTVPLPPRVYWSAADETATSTTSSSPQVKTSVTVASPPANRDVLWLYSMRLSLPVLNSDALGDFFDGTATLSAWNIEGKDTSDLVGVAGISRWQTGGSPSSTTFSLRYSAEAGVSTEAHYARIVGIQMETGDQYAETATASSASASYQTATTLTFDPGATEDYLLLVSGEISNTAATRISFIQVTVDGVAQPEFIRSLKDVTNFYPFFFCKRITLAAGSRTILLQYHSDGTATATLRNGRVACLKLSGFDASYSAQDDTADTTTQATYKDWVTLTETPDAGDHLVVMNTLHGGNVATISNYVNYLQDATVLAEYLAEAGTTTDTAAWTQAVVGLRDLAAAATTWKNQYRSETTSTTSSISWSSINVVQLFQSAPDAPIGDYAATWDAWTAAQAGSPDVAGDASASIDDATTAQAATLAGVGDYAATLDSWSADQATDLHVTGEHSVSWAEWAATQDAVAPGPVGDYAAAWEDVVAAADGSVIVDGAISDTWAAWVATQDAVAPGPAADYDAAWSDAAATAAAIIIVGGDTSDTWAAWVATQDAVAPGPVAEYAAAWDDAAVAAAAAVLDLGEYVAAIDEWTSEQEGIAPGVTGSLDAAWEDAAAAAGATSSITGDLAGWEVWAAAQAASFPGLGEHAADWAAWSTSYTGALGPEQIIGDYDATWEEVAFVAAAAALVMGELSAPWSDAISVGTAVVQAAGDYVTDWAGWDATQAGIGIPTGAYAATWADAAVAAAGSVAVVAEHAAAWDDWATSQVASQIDQRVGDYAAPIAAWAATQEGIATPIAFGDYTAPVDDAAAADTASVAATGAYAPDPADFAADYSAALTPITFGHLDVIWDAPSASAVGGPEAAGAVDAVHAPFTGACGGSVYIAGELVAEWDTADASYESSLGMRTTRIRTYALPQIVKQIVRVR